MKTKKIKIEVSSRHLHISREVLDKLFGKDYELQSLKKLSQPGEFAAKETVTLKNGQPEISNVRIIGPTRSKTQIEISMTDAYKLKLNPPIRMSGKLKDSSGIILIGPKGKVKLSEGLIIAERHIHASDKDALKLGLKNNTKVDVEVAGKRALVFKNVKVRVNPNYALSMHVDTDEANASGIVGVGSGKMILK